MLPGNAHQSIPLRQELVLCLVGLEGIKLLAQLRNFLSHFLGLAQGRILRVDNRLASTMKLIGFLMLVIAVVLTLVFEYGLTVTFIGGGDFRPFLKA